MLPGHYLFPSVRTPRRPMSDVTMVAALRRMGFSKDQHVPHGFRSMFSTICHEAEKPVDVIEATLAHSIPGVRGVYARTDHWARRVELVEWYGNLLDSLRNDTQNVLPFSATSRLS